MKVTLTESSRGIFIRPSSNNTPSNPPSGRGSKRKALPEKKSDDELTSGIGDKYHYYLLVIDGYFRMGDVRGSNGSMNSHTVYQQGWCFNNGDLSCGNDFTNVHTICRCNDLITFKEVAGDVKNCDVSGGHGFMNIHTLYQQNNFKPLINSKNTDDIEINADLNNGGLSCIIGRINSHTLFQFNKSSYVNGIYWGV